MSVLCNLIGTDLFRSAPCSNFSFCARFEAGVELGLTFTGGNPKPAGKALSHRVIRVKKCKKKSRSFTSGVRPSDVLVCINNEVMLGRSLNTA